MKVGDLVHMPNESVPDGSVKSIGIVIADDYRTRNQRRKNNRIGIMWADSDRVDYEPRAWLEVINENR